MTTITARNSEGWTFLVGTIEQLSAARTIDDVVGIVRETARRLVGADGVTFVRRDGDQCHYVDEDAVAPLWKGRKFPMSQCISGWCMLNRQTAVIPDIYADDRIPHAAYRPTFVKSLVMTPVRVENPMAAIGAYWSDARSPDPEEVALLQTLARSTSIALANAELYENLVRQAHSLRGMVDELNHRVKNTLSTVQSIAAQSFRGAQCDQPFNDVFTERLQALSAVHNLLNESGWERITLSSLLRAATAPYFEGRTAVTLAGADLKLSANAAVTLGLALHELAANAVKHGALSAPFGTVKVSCEAGDPIQIVWREDGAVRPSQPQQMGFGRRLIERGLVHELGAEASLNFRAGGVECRIAVPRSSTKVAVA